MKGTTQGFTLIELLIVIAIIGILAAVLIPNLLNARKSAAVKAAQAHSANVYKAAVATLADDNAQTIGAVVTAMGGNDCTKEVKVTASQPYGFPTAPSAVASCTIAADASGSDFAVNVTSSADSGSKKFLNGAPQP